MRLRNLLIVSILLGLLSACITTPDEVKIAAIHGAIAAGDTQQVTQLAASRKQLTALNEYGETPLLYAVKIRKPAMVDILLAKGADVNVANSHSGETPLIAAVRNNDVAMVQRLLAAGARLDQADSEGATPLVWACRSGGLDVVQALIAKLGRAEVSKTPAAVLTAAAFGHRQLVQSLLDMGGAIDARSARAETPLILASRFGHRDTVQLLIGKGANVNAIDTHHASALMWAARLGHDAIVGDLLDAGATPGVKDTQGFTPLAHAVRLGQDKVVKRLVNWSSQHRLPLGHDLHLMYWAALQPNIAEVLYQVGAEDSQVYQGEVPAIEAAIRYLWLARYYEYKLIASTGRDDFDHTNMDRSYAWAATFFDTAADQYALTAERIKSQRAAAEVGAVFMNILGAAANAVQADLHAKQMAEIGALGQASSQGTGLSGYYSALDSYKRAYTPSGGGLILGSPYGRQSPPPKLSDPAAVYLREATRSKNTADASRAIVDCYRTSDYRAKAVSDCVVSASKGIQYLK
jgi:ankyrin repeat protein